MAKKLPAIPNTEQDPDQNQRKLRVLEKQRKKIKEHEDDLNKSLKHLEQTIDKSFKFVCALRLDIIADLLEKTNPEWSREIDTIAGSIEKGDGNE
jgi:hypothetical protein